MTTELYTCRDSASHGTYVFTKLDSDFDLLGRYSTSAHECDCPRGSKHTCRHREMLKWFLRDKHIGDGWFLDWSTRLWRRPIGEGIAKAEALLADRTELGNAEPAQPSPMLGVKNPTSSDGVTVSPSVASPPAPEQPATPPVPVAGGPLVVRRRKV